MANLYAWLHIGQGTEPRQTIKVPARDAARPWKGRTVSGYGRAIPTERMVLFSGRWRRVVVAQYGNAGTAYILGENREWIIVQDVAGE